MPTALGRQIAISIRVVLIPSGGSRHADAEPSAWHPISGVEGGAGRGIGGGCHKGGEVWQCHSAAQGGVVVKLPDSVRA